jgi:hypothetical protein
MAWQKGLAACSICIASSRVGARINTLGAPEPLESSTSLSPFILRALCACSTAGITYARVFPDPVSAMPIKSLPATMAGHDFACTSVGVVNPCSRSSAMSSAAVKKVQSNGSIEGTTVNMIQNFPESGLFSEFQQQDIFASRLIPRRNI